MIQPGTMTLTLQGDREILVTRQFDAPRNLVYDAFTKPELLKRWFTGPEFASYCPQIEWLIEARFGEAVQPREGPLPRAPLSWPDGEVPR